MNRRINLRQPARPANLSLDPAEAQWLESVSQTLLRHIAFLKQLKLLNLPAASAPDQISVGLPVTAVSAPQCERLCRSWHWPCLVVIPRHLNFSLLASRAANRA